jgi:predicted O-methyltransferase YrrM
LRRATRTLDELIERGESGSYDYAFIDADKTNYDAYYERVLTLLRPGGLILIDNVLWSGKVADPAVTDADTVALRELNAKVHRDERVDASLVGIGDGLLLARKR